MYYSDIKSAFSISIEKYLKQFNKDAPLYGACFYTNINKYLKPTTALSSIEFFIRTNNSFSAHFIVEHIINEINGVNILSLLHTEPTYRNYYYKNILRPPWLKRECEIAASIYNLKNIFNMGWNNNYTKTYGFLISIDIETFYESYLYYTDCLVTDIIPDNITYVFESPEIKEIDSMLIKNSGNLGLIKAVTESLHPVKNTKSEKGKKNKRTRKTVSMPVWQSGASIRSFQI